MSSEVSMCRAEYVCCGVNNCIGDNLVNNHGELLTPTTIPLSTFFDNPLTSSKRKVMLKNSLINVNHYSLLWHFMYKLWIKAFIFSIVGIRNSPSMLWRWFEAERGRLSGQGPPWSQYWHANTTTNTNILLYHFTGLGVDTNTVTLVLLLDMGTISLWTLSMWENTWLKDIDKIFLNISLT